MMSRDSNGTYNLPSGNPVLPGTVIESDWANTTMSDIAGALTGSIAANGVTEPTANLPMGGFHHTGVSAATARNQYLTLGVAQDGLAGRVTLSSGSGDNLVGTMTGTPPAYSDGMIVSWIQPANNTGAVTLQVGALPARSVFDSAGVALTADALIANTVYIAYYSSDRFVLIAATAIEGSEAVNASAISGSIRPSNDTFPSMTIASGTTVNIPAGTGFINLPDAGGNMLSTYVTWDAQVITLLYAATSFITSILVNSDGTIRQEPGIVSPGLLRECIVLGQVIHVAGSATSIINTPAIYNDDTYLARDTTYILGSQLALGGRITGNTTVPLRMDIAAGAIFMPGASANTPNTPNFQLISQTDAISFRALAGASTLGSVIQSAPVASYDPGGAGTVTALTGAANATVHRLYWLGGEYIWVYGQVEYATVAEAITYIVLDRSTYQRPSAVQSGVLIAEIIARKDATDFVTAGTTAIISSAGQQYLFGSSQSINEAPAGPLVYGRNATSGWVATISGTAPSVTGNLTITKAQPRVVEDYDPATAGWAGLQVQQVGIDWFTIEVSTPGDITYFRSYNPATGALRYSTSYNLANGVWNFPVAPTIAGVAVGDVSGPATATTVGTMVLWNDTTGNTVSMGSTPGNVVTKTIQTSATDSTADRVMMTGAFGLGGVEALNLPKGTTAQRNGSPAAGDFRYNTTTSSIEFYNGSAWSSGDESVAQGYLNGYTLSNSTINVSKGLDISAGLCAGTGTNASMSLATAMGKRIDVNWVAGGTTAVPAGGFPSGISLTTSTWYAVFAISTAAGVVDVGFDSSLTATNLLADATGYVNYRRIGWVYYNGSSVIEQFFQNGDVFTFETVQLAKTTATVSTVGAPVVVLAPPETLAKLNVLFYTNQNSTQYYILTENRQSNTSPSLLYSNLNSNGGTGTYWVNQADFERMTDSSSAIRERATSGFTRIMSIGWTDNRNR